MFKSPKTTIMAILLIAQQVLGIAVALLDGNTATVPDWGTAMAAIMAAIGFLFARDQAEHDKGN